MTERTLQQSGHKPALLPFPLENQPLAQDLVHPLLLEFPQQIGHAGRAHVVQGPPGELEEFRLQLRQRVGKQSAPCQATYEILENGMDLGTPNHGIEGPCTVGSSQGSIPTTRFR